MWSEHEARSYNELNVTKMMLLISSYIDFLPIRLFSKGVYTHNAQKVTYYQTVTVTLLRIIL